LLSTGLSSSFWNKEQADMIKGAKNKSFFIFDLSVRRELVRG
jgi:hypothetical protein